MEKGDENDEIVQEYIKTNVIWIPRSPSRPEVFEIQDFTSIQLNEIIAINAIYGSITIHNDNSGLIKRLIDDQENLISFSAEIYNGFNNRDSTEIKVLFIPGKDEIINKEFEKSKYLVDSNYEGNIFTVYSLILSRSLSETMPFKNRRYWRRTHLYARLTVYYGEKYPIINPGLLFEFSLELPESIEVKLIEEIQEILLNRSGDQECIFQVINCLEMILENLCDYLQISEDLWEQMRRQNNQREFEKHLDNSVIYEDDGNNYMNNEDLEKLIDLKISGINYSTKGINDKDEKLNDKTASEMVSGFLDDTILDYPVNTSEIVEENDTSNIILNLDLSYIRKEIFEHNINYSLFSSKRFTQDFRVLEVLYSGRNVIITKSLHLIDQNNYQVSIYRIPSSKFNQIQKKVSSLVMLQHRYMVRYYQCWVEKCDNKKDERNDQEDFLLLYIQSEFMEENITLFEFFEKGKITTRDNHLIWSLFRQILEIMSYCHRNEVFHLNLSSNCIYIEEDIYGYSVKLSNFIFGSHLDLNFDNNNEEFSLPNILFTEIKKFNDEILLVDISCTCQIFLEMWLKIKYKGLEYEKFNENLLDWLSKLKIVNENVSFKEMNQLSLEISKNIDELFVFNIDIPLEFKYIPKTALIIMRKLKYETNFKNNNSIDDLLKSDLLPSSINKNEFQYYLSRICNPNTYESHITLNTLFGRNVDKISYTAFLMDIKSDEKVNMIDLTFSDIVKTSITKIFDDHNFVLWKLPILYPTQFLTDKRIDTVNNSKDFEQVLYDCGYRTSDPHFLLDISNNLLCLPKSAPFSMISSLISLLFGDHFNQNTVSSSYFSDFENKSKKSSGIGIDGISGTNNGFKNVLKIDDLHTNIISSNNSNILPGLYCRDLSMDILEDSPIQRYVLFPIYEQPNNSINNGLDNHVFGSPRTKLSLAFDMIYKLNESDFSTGISSSGGNYNDLNMINLNQNNQRLIINQTCGNLLCDDLKRIYQSNDSGQTISMDNIILEVEGLLLSLKLILPWLDYLEDVPIVRLTFPLMSKIIYLELLEKMLSGKLEEDDINKRKELDLFTQKSIFKEIYNINIKENRKDKQREDEEEEEEEEEKEGEKEKTFIRELFLRMHAFEWKYESNIGNYRLKSVYENNFIMKTYEFIRDNQIIKLYVQVLNEVLNLLSESTELLIYKDKKVKFYLDPIMDYDVNLYDQTTLVYSITSEKKGINMIYGMGGSYSYKINGIINSLFKQNSNISGGFNTVNIASLTTGYGFDNKNTFTNFYNNSNENCINNMGGLGISKFPNFLNCIMGEVSIELIINQVCEKAKRYRAEFVNTGGYINGISINDLSMMNGGINLNISSFEKTIGSKSRRSSWAGFNNNIKTNIDTSSIPNFGNKEKNFNISTLKQFNHQSELSLGIYDYEEITDLSKELLLRPISLLKSCYPRVIVMTQTTRLQPKVLSLTRRLWQNGVRSEYRLSPVRSLAIFLEKLKRDTLVELLIVVMFQNSNIGSNSVNYFHSSLCNSTSIGIGTMGFGGAPGVLGAPTFANGGVTIPIGGIATVSGAAAGATVGAATGAAGTIGTTSGAGVSALSGISSSMVDESPSQSYSSSNMINQDGYSGAYLGNIIGSSSTLGAVTGVGTSASGTTTTTTTPTVTTTASLLAGTTTTTTMAIAVGGTGIVPATSLSGTAIGTGTYALGSSNSTVSECTKNKNVIFRIEPISGFYYETNAFNNIKVIMDNEESVVNYVLTKRKKQIIN
ncbi:protein kinase [Cryptosporidium ubiquitum]|uniref:Protein kinase n=1 Tax=Cryptosporidium ubiquitum TaxID=857276 RepID=A0A1J4MJB6_9CRYT|nr:protein kinase [Cryptosporidium ubiquitum]OII72949.1 protein kinase [Cryptosporidium ubiquitum]